MTRSDALLHLRIIRKEIANQIAAGLHPRNFQGAMRKVDRQHYQTRIEAIDVAIVTLELLPD